MTETKDQTEAFVDWGRWVANCPRCLSAGIVRVREAYYECAARPVGCGRVSRIVWPEDPAAIMAGLAGRPEHQQYWKPEHE